MPTPAQIVNFLRSNNFIGDHNTIIARDLALHFQISDGGTEVPMRNDIKLALQQGELIGSNNRGYYLIDNLQELDDNLNSLQSRAEETLARRRNLLNTWNTANPTNPSTLNDLNVR